MLVDAAKYGDVEIPVFCYEPKLGAPVGACRMCLVEIEGIPKLQTGCSTAVKDGMVVYTQTERVKTAQRSVVEFLLINHPLDCPVCDKGGECPLQDITFGWGSGISRFVEPKRHFVKPLELSPLVAIDRERCILCYRCVRFSQEVAEDYQLVLLERGAHSYVATFDGHPYVAPFAGNIVELCPVGALTSRPYRFRARPWDIEDAGSVCTLCPSQCNVTRDGPRRARAARAGAREPRGRRRLAVRQGPLRLPVLPRRRAHHAPARARRRSAAAGRVGARARAGGRDAAARRRRARPRWPAPARPTRRGCCSRACCARGSARRTSTRAARARCRWSCTGPSETPRCRRAHPTSSSPTSRWCSTSSPSTTPRSSTCACARARAGAGLQIARRLPEGEHARAERRPDRALRARTGRSLRGGARGGAARPSHRRRSWRRRRAARRREVRAPGTAAARRGRRASAREVVLLWGERLTAGPRGAAGARALLAIAEALGMASTPGAGLLEVPLASNGRGLREAGVLPNAGPGLSEPAGAGAARDTTLRRSRRRSRPAS